MQPHLGCDVGSPSPPDPVKVLPVEVVDLFAAQRLDRALHVIGSSCLWAISVGTQLTSNNELPSQESMQT
eukprot:scaffold23082_cov19-Prasinocladus_malaysianus.AAC.2